MGKGKIKLGERVLLGYFPSAKYFGTTGYVEARYENSIIEIGERTKINNDFSIIANKTQIKIGSDCDIGVGFKCVDSDFHGINFEDRHNEEKVINKPVSIGDKTFIGDNVTILKGVTLGENCVVGAGSVVTKSFDANSVIAGNPAKVIQHTH
ncbi:acyltransferase [bacterium]|nr:acyltransferase [bacterium]